jgi:hypothetical protein
MRYLRKLQARQAVLQLRKRRIGVPAERFSSFKFC